MMMTRTSRLVPATAVAALAAVALTASPALADGGRGHSILRAELVGSMPAPASPVIAGVNPGGAPWVNGPSSVRVREDGRITVSITGLVIPPPRGTNTNPIASVVATLVCDDMVRSSTAPFALSPAGDGSTSDRISGTHRCEDPVVLIQPAGNRAVYIASAMGEHDDD
jgi:hypothetical protein